MGTPFIALQEPNSLAAYNRLLPPSEQAPSIPRTFVDAMTVRQEVFVEEQSVPLEYEFDEDDPRSCHWVVYASVNKTVTPEIRDPESGEVVQVRQSETSSVPVGTVRLVPFPHPPHPVDGGVYVDGRLIDGPHGEEQQRHEHRDSMGPVFPTDRATDMHDGTEPYVKLGRLAVVKEFRGHKLGGLLVRTALDWARQHPGYFNPSIAALGLEQLGVEKGGLIPKWNGLVCCHAQQSVIGAWEKLGFKVDKGMGTWIEEGIPHVGMFQRLEIKQIPHPL
jgi:predicted GNAT family N-acyltransferase